MPVCHSAKHRFDHTPGLEATKRFNMSYANLNFFFFKGKEKGGDEQTRTTLSHGWEHLLKYFNLHENKMDKYQTHQTQNPFG